MTTTEIAREIRAIAAAYEMESGAVVRLVTLAREVEGTITAEEATR